MAEPLGDVLTVREVCRAWRRCRSAVRYHLDRGHFRWRYTADGKILIDKASVIALWGKPLDDSVPTADDWP